MRWEHNIREWIGLKFTKSQRAVENREKWRKLIVKSSVVPQTSPTVKGWMMMMMNGYTEEEDCNFFFFTRMTQFLGIDRIRSDVATLLDYSHGSTLTLSLIHI